MCAWSPGPEPERGELHSEAGAPPSSTFAGDVSPSAPPLAQRSPLAQSLLVPHGLRLFAQRSAGQLWPDGHSASVSHGVTVAGWHQPRSQVEPLGQLALEVHAVTVVGAHDSASCGSASAGLPIPNDSLYWVSCAHCPKPKKSRSMVSLPRMYIALPTSIPPPGRLRKPKPPGVLSG